MPPALRAERPTGRDIRACAADSVGEDEHASTSRTRSPRSAPACATASATDDVPVPCRGADHHDGGRIILVAILFECREQLQDARR